LLVAIATVTAVLMLAFVRYHEIEPATELVAVTTEAAATITVPAYPLERFRPPDDPQWPGHWADPPPAWTGVIPPDLLRSDATLAEVRIAVSELPELHRRVLVLRDIDGRTPREISESLDLGGDEVLGALHAARLHVRRRLESFFSEYGYG
jgi:DNA-directed RNA polymerase specialized sigma24 family protein